MNLIGLDIGTSGCKATVFDADGHLLGSASREYAVNMPHPGWAEQDAERVWQLACAAIHQVLSVTNTHQAAAVGLSVQGEAVMPVDAQGDPLRPAILGMDTRTGEQNAWLDQHFSGEYLFHQTGMPLHTINTLPKLLWIKQNEPQIWRAATHFRLYEDFFIARLCGTARISRCLASRTQMYDLADDRWSSQILEAIGLDTTRLSAVSPSGTPVGEMRPDLAEEWGLRNRPLVVTGGHDQACGALGVGLVRPGLSLVSTGTAEVVEVALASPALTEPLRRGNISVYAHTVPGLYLAMTLNHSGGLLLRWFRDTFCQEEIRQAAMQGSDTYDLIFGGLSPDPSPLLLLPHFSGSGTPTFDTASKGALIGLTFSSTRDDLAKAILDGLTFELRYNLEVLRQGGVKIDELRAIGGGARSKLWLQLKADVTSLPVVAPSITEAASWGAAMLAGFGAGLFTNLSQTAQSALRFEQRFEPDPQRARSYDERYRLYLDLYPAVAPLSHRM
jgi:xylulokinase